jgi:hypothetical protein
MGAGFYPAPQGVSNAFDKKINIFVMKIFRFTRGPEIL